jgi:adenylate cyclase
VNEPVPAEPTALHAAPASRKWKRGFLRLKGPLLAFAGVGAVLSGLAGWWNTYMTVRSVAKATTTVSGPGPSTPAPATVAAASLSVVVLPFANQTGDPQKAYIADGLTSSLTADLSRIRDARIVPAATAFTYRDKGLTVEQIGQALGVGYVLSGSVLSGGQKLRISAQLADASTGAQVWSRSFDGELSDLMALQDQVTTEIAKSTGDAMVVNAARQSEKRKGNPSAMDLRLRARALNFQPQSAELLARAQALLRQSLVLEPDQPSTQLELASSLVVLANNFERGAANAQLREKHKAEARELTMKANAVEPDSVRACRMMGTFAQEDGQLAASRSIWERCLRLSPKSVPLLGDLAQTWIYDGADGARKAVALLKQAAEVEGANPSEVTQLNLGEALFAAGDSAGAIEHLQVGMRLNPKLTADYLYLAMAYADLGDAARLKEVSAKIASIRQAGGLPEAADFKEFEANNSVGTPGYRSLREKRFLPLWRKAGLPG